jgi:integrase
MILLASRLGMRSGDIVLLRCKDVDFNTDEVNIIQQKTGKNLHLPLIPEVKTALQEYLDARAVFEEEHIFLNVYAPYHPVTTSTMRSAIRKYMTLAAIDIGARKHGPHSLRSSLASAMVNDSISYETVRKVLGHSSNNAIKHYARIDIEKLRLYSIPPAEPSGAFLRYLNGEV